MLADNPTPPGAQSAGTTTCNLNFLGRSRSLKLDIALGPFCDCDEPGAHVIKHYRKLASGAILKPVRMRALADTIEHRIRPSRYYR